MDYPPPVQNAPSIDNCIVFNNAPPLGGGPIPGNGIPPFNKDGPPPINNNQSNISSGSLRSQAPHPACDCPSAGLHGRTIPTQPPFQPPVMLCISPSEEGGACRFIYLSSREISDQAAIIAYFNNTGREVSGLPCQDFNEFLASNHLRVHQVSFVTDLTNYIIPVGRCIIEENNPSKEVALNLSWLPSPPSISLRSGNSRPTVHAGYSSPAFSSSTFCHGAGSDSNNYTASEWGASSADLANSSQQSSCHSIPPARTGSGPTTSVMTTRAPHADMVETPHRPDPKGILVPNTPLFFSMGVPVSVKTFLPLSHVTLSHFEVVHSRGPKFSPPQLCILPVVFQLCLQLQVPCYLPLWICLILQLKPSP